MNHQEELPYIARCGFCEQGLLRFMRCHSCTTVVAVCDECELVWLDIAAVKDDPAMPASSAFPKCPACHSPHPHWSRLTAEEIKTSSLSRYMAEATAPQPPTPQKHPQPPTRTARKPRPKDQ